MWQTIDSAPKDGEGVLLFCPSYPGEVHAAVWHEGRGLWTLWGLSSVSFDFDDDDQPTHWMPLPEGPK